MWWYEPINNTVFLLRFCPCQELNDEGVPGSGLAARVRVAVLARRAPPEALVGGTTVSDAGGEKAEARNIMPVAPEMPFCTLATSSKRPGRTATRQEWRRTLERPSFVCQSVVMTESSDLYL